MIITKDQIDTLLKCAAGMSGILADNACGNPECEACKHELAVKAEIDAVLAVFCKELGIIMVDIDPSVDAANTELH